MTTNVLDSLTPVRFYTAFDAYYYTVDNRPIEDLNNNLIAVATAADASTGEGRRAALGGASIAQAITGIGSGDGAAVGSYDLTLGGLTMDILHSFGTFMVAGVDDINTYQKPILAVHDGVTRLNTFVPGNPTYSSVYVVQMTWRDPTDEDKVPTTSSDVKVAEITTIRTGDITIGNSVIPFTPAAGSIVLMYVVIPSGTTVLTEDNLQMVNFRSIAQTSRLENNAQVSYKIHNIDGINGQQTLDLSTSTIDVSRPTSIEVFVDGVNQFNWTYDIGNKSIELESPLGSNADVKVRQANLSLI